MLRSLFPRLIHFASIAFFLAVALAISNGADLLQ